jgi:hypothetical protein
MLGVALLWGTVGCGIGDSQPTPISETSTQTSIVHTELPTGIPPVMTSVSTMTSALASTITSHPTITPMKVGSFELSYALDPEVAGVLPIVRLPNWVELCGEKESASLAQVTRAYQPLTLPDGSGTLAEVFKVHYRDVVATADDYLGVFPDSDGAIPVLMMLGHVHSYQVGWHWGRSAELLGREYERAVALLLKRHPERLQYILDDLIELGLPINWVQATDRIIDNGEVLLFSYQFSAPFGEPKGRIYGLVQESNHSWGFAPLPTRYAGGCQHSARVEIIEDVNADGRTEILVALEHVYAGGPGLWLNVFAWRDGGWTDRLSWNTLGRDLYWNPPSLDAYYGRFWLEDLNEDDVQEIVVGYPTGSPGGGNPTTVEVYQWDQAAEVYTNTRPIKVQVCGYHAFAEAERRRALGDLEGSIQWYEEARRRWRAELSTPNPVCLNYGTYDWGKREIAESYQIQLAVQHRMSSESGDGWGLYIRNINDEYQVEMGEVSLITETGAITGVEGWQMRVNLFQCDVEPCRAVGHFYPSTVYTRDRSSGDRVICTGGTRHNYDDRNGDGSDDLRQVTHWNCQVRDAQDAVLLGQDGPYIETTCLWDGRRFALSDSQVLTPAIVLTGTVGTSQLAGVVEDLAGLVDCSGDK